MDIKLLLTQTFHQAMLDAGIDDPNPVIRQSQRPEFGHYQANGVMGAAKRMRTNPRTLADLIVSLLPPQDQYTLEIAGPGFIDITLTPTFVSQLISNRDPAEEPIEAAPRRVVVDYSSPNLAKEMHIGHLRSTVIGDTVVRVLEHTGQTAIRANHVGDWGAQFGSLLAYLDESSNNETAQTAELADLEKFYQRASKKFKNDIGFAEKARGYVVRLQSGDPALKKLWEVFIQTSMDHGQNVYDKLNITLTQQDAMPESRYNSDLLPLVSDLTEKGLLEKSEGALCVFLDEFMGKNDRP